MVDAIRPHEAVQSRKVAGPGLMQQGKRQAVPEPPTGTAGGGCKKTKKKKILRKKSPKYSTKKSLKKKSFKKGSRKKTLRKKSKRKSKK